MHGTDMNKSLVVYKTKQYICQQHRTPWDCINS